VNLVPGSGPTYAAQNERTTKIPIIGGLGPERQRGKNAQWGHQNQSHGYKMKCHDS
jgi:hypothetical protein